MTERHTSHKRPMVFPRTGLLLKSACGTVVSCLFMIFPALFLLSGCGEHTGSQLPLLKPALSFKLRIPALEGGRGGIIATDLNGDARPDFLITSPGHIAAHDNSGRELWTLETDIQLTRKSELEGLPGLHAPGIQAADIDGNGSAEVLFLTSEGRLIICDGKSGRKITDITIASPEEAHPWEHLAAACFRGAGDRDLLLQATGKTRYRMGRFIAAYSLEDLLEKKEGASLLWQQTDFIANAHNGARLADLDGDGRDEVLGGSIIGPEGRMLFKIPLKGHVDSIFTGDIRPDIPGLETIALEEGGGAPLLKGKSRPVRLINRIYRRLFPKGNHIFLFNHEGLIWKKHYKHREPQNAAIGDFDPDTKGLEIWCRSRYNTHQKPFVFNAEGMMTATYKMKDKAPENWTIKGVEVINTIDWTGDKRQLCVAKERHKSGDVAIFDPIRGDFLLRIHEKADRLMVADVTGDWREEIVVINGDTVHIYKNQNPNPSPDHQSLWARGHYKRSKMTWNYYNP